MNEYQRAESGDHGGGGASRAGAPGKRTLTQAIYRKAEAAAVTAPGDAFAQATAGPAGPVPHLAAMERAFGETFGGVLAHSGPSTEAGLGALGARAAAQGETVAFRDAAPSPELVAHELTHVVQARRGGGGVQCAREVSEPGDAAEREADAAAATVAAGGTVQVGEVASAGIHRQEAPAAPAPAGSLQSEADPQGVELRDLFVTCALPAGTVLGSKDYGVSTVDFTTRHDTMLVATLSSTSLTIEAWPHLYVDVPWPGENCILRSISITFADRQIHVDVVQDDDSWGAGDQSDTVRDRLRVELHEALSGTALLTRGYNPLRDPHPRASLESVMRHLTESLPAGGGTAAAPPASHPAVGADFSFKQGLEIASGSGALHIEPGRNIKLTVQGGGTLADIAAADTRQAQVDAAAVGSIELETTAIEVRSDGGPVALLKRVRVERGGRVVVDPGAIELLGSAASAGSGESLFRAFLGILGNPAAEPDIFPRIVDGMTRSTIEESLTAALRPLILQHRNAIPGVDLAATLGIE